MSILATGTKPNPIFLDSIIIETRSSSKLKIRVYLISIESIFFNKDSIPLRKILVISIDLFIRILQLVSNQFAEAIENIRESLLIMKKSAFRAAQRELEENERENDLFDQCLKKADDDEEKAKRMYIHQRAAEIAPNEENLDEKEKWPMLVPLLILYSAGTIAVLSLVFGFLRWRLGWL
tara:strand:+ start:635 stop:1171 length:537 start_codon:yes stop_codon:yes gene_type:complete